MATNDTNPIPLDVMADAQLIAECVAGGKPIPPEVFDCLYVALAERERCELVTADDRLVRTLQPQFPFIVPLASLP